jgi:hypothetical protein
METITRSTAHPAVRGRKPIRWSHQNELDTLRGRNVVLSVAGGSVTGMLVEADQFAIKISGEFLHTGKQSTMTYFKHSIESFRAA